MDTVEEWLRKGVDEKMGTEETGKEEGDKTVVGMSNKRKNVN